MTRIHEYFLVFGKIKFNELLTSLSCSFLNNFTITSKKHFCKSFKPNRNFHLFFYSSSFLLYLHSILRDCKGLSILSIGKTFFEKNIRFLTNLLKLLLNIGLLSHSTSFSLFFHWIHVHSHTSTHSHILL